MPVQSIPVQQTNRLGRTYTAYTSRWVADTSVRSATALVSDDQLRREIRNYKARARYQPQEPRLFPVGYGTADWPLIETTEADGTVRIDYQGDPNYSALQIAEYVRKFCELNHLKG